MFTFWSHDLEEDLYNYQFDDEYDSSKLYRDLEEKERRIQLTQAVEVLDDELFGIGFLDKDAVAKCLSHIIFDMNLTCELGYVYADQLTIERSTKETILQQAIQDPVYQAEQALWYATTSATCAFDSSFSDSPFFAAGVSALSETLHSIQKDLQKKREEACHPGFSSPEDAIRALVDQLTSKKPLHVDTVKKSIDCLAKEYQFELPFYSRDELEIVRV